MGAWNMAGEPECDALAFEWRILFREESQALRVARGNWASWRMYPAFPCTIDEATAEASTKV
jgi:hypothetical protein